MTDRARHLEAADSCRRGRIAEIEDDELRGSDQHVEAGEIRDRTHFRRIPAEGEPTDAHRRGRIGDVDNVDHAFVLVADVGVIAGNRQAEVGVRVEVDMSNPLDVHGLVRRCVDRDIDRRVDSGRRPAVARSDRKQADQATHQTPSPMRFADPVAQRRLCKRAEVLRHGFRPDQHLRAPTVASYLATRGVPSSLPERADSPTSPRQVTVSVPIWTLTTLFELRWSSGLQRARSPRPPGTIRQRGREHGSSRRPATRAPPRFRRPPTRLH